MAQKAGRIVCPRCGANNFDTVSTCWKCTAPLSGGALPVTPVVPPSAAPSAYPAPAAPPLSPAERLQHTANTAAFAMSGAGTVPGNPAVANRAAFWLGILFPYFGIPLALAFMMCDDRRRQEVGRICLLWSSISMVVHLLLGFVTLLGMRQYIAFAFGSLRGQMQRGGGLGGGGLGGGMDGF